jgi:thiamine biosynthesis lipoprotein
MGTVLQMTLCGVGGSPAPAAASDTLFAVAEKLDRELTTYAPTSAILRLNAAAGSGPTSVPADLHRILSESVRSWRQTAGAFDVTVGPLTALWRQAGERGSAPDHEELREVLERVGSEKITLLDHDKVALARPGMALDLGGIGKGYALDRMAERLPSLGIRSALLDFGGSSWVAIGTPPDAPAWRVLLRRPDGGVLGVINLQDEAISISETFGQSAVVGGRRKGHIVDPRTGQPIDVDRRTCVVAPSATQAEALSTALVVQGREGLGALERLHQSGIEALLAQAGDPPARTSGFDRAVAFAPL